MIPFEERNHRHQFLCFPKCSQHTEAQVGLLPPPSPSLTPSDSKLCTLLCIFSPLKHHGDHSVSAHINLSHSSEKQNRTYYGLLKDTEVASNVLLVLKIMHEIILYIQDLGQYIQKSKFLAELLDHLVHAL